MTAYQRHNQAGFATVTVLALAAVLLSMLAAIASLNYAVHEQNRRYARTLQQQADRMEFTARPPGGK